MVEQVRVSRLSAPLSSSGPCLHGQLTARTSLPQANVHAMIQRRATAGGVFCAAGNPAGKVDHFPIGVDGFDKEAINNNGLPSGGVQRRAGSPKRT
jgi:hypothetical protein